MNDLRGRICFKKLLADCKTSELIKDAIGSIKTVNEMEQS